MAPSDNGLEGCLLSLFGRMRRRPSTTDVGDGRPLPYRTADSLLTPAEISFYHTLQGVLPEGLLLCPQVRMADVLFVTNMRRNYGYFGRISQKHVDLVVCDAQTLKPVVAIELDDGSHQRSERRSRDAFVDEAFAAAGLPLLRFQVQRAYQPNELLERIQPHRPGTEVHSDRTTRDLAGPGEPPRCARRGELLVVRTARQGSRAGSQFYGCPNYPACRYTQPLGQPTAEAPGSFEQETPT